MRALVIGASGQLGHALATAFATKHEVIESGYRHARPGHRVIDLGDSMSMAAALAETRPDVVVIAGAQCNVDRCETEIEECERINVAAPRAIARWAREHDALVVYYSTDQVFDGTKDWSVETDAIAPCNSYARSKAEGEAAIREHAPDRHLILRTSWLYGPDRERRNFALRLVDRLRRDETVRAPCDQFGCPTYTEDLAAATLALVDRGVSGTFHACGPDLIDRVSLAREICRRFGLKEALVVATPTAELRQAAPRPRRVAMDCSKIHAVVEARFRGVEPGVMDLRTSEGDR